MQTQADENFDFLQTCSLVRGLDAQTHIVGVGLNVGLFVFTIAANACLRMILAFAIYTKFSYSSIISIFEIQLNLCKSATQK